ncbi:MAG: molybdopterin-dependent oxidoreductase, partial [Flavobacteriaceae bacterium]|nr:molybdopterin-dependent oxidoreductase [Flavobacteriaceae bacterium]
DLNGKAVEMACNSLKERLLKVASKMLSSEDKTITFRENIVFVDEKKSAITWNDVVAEAMLQRVALTENTHYATPIIHFDKSVEKGHPFAYHVYGTAITQVTVDCLRGTYEIDAVKIIHDFGKSMNIGIDIGQVEGALAQGIGWMTMEEIAYGKDGRLLSNALSTYKVPDIFSAAKTVEVLPLETTGNEMAIKKSKAVGEPPLMYGIGSYYAIQYAVKAFNTNYKPKYHSPFTPEKVLMGLYEK